MGSNRMLNLTMTNSSYLFRGIDPNYTSLSSDESTPSSSIVVAVSKQPSSIATSAVMEDYTEQGFVVAKITLLLIVTAVVLIVSYRFVVRLFLGYADRKDDVVQDGISDDEDSAVIKRAVEHSYEIG